MKIRLFFLVKEETPSVFFENLYEKKRRILTFNILRFSFTP
jgi:hypothetical protein